MIRRTSKDDALSGLENWINEVVAQRADGQNEAIPAFIKNGFQRSLQASAEYHEELAKGLANDDDHALSKYHTLMSEIYANLMCD